MPPIPHTRASSSASDWLKKCSGVPSGGGLEASLILVAAAAAGSLPWSARAVAAGGKKQNVFSFCFLLFARPPFLPINGVLEFHYFL